MVKRVTGIISLTFFFCFLFLTTGVCKEQKTAHGGDVKNIHMLINLLQEKKVINKEEAAILTKEFEKKAVPGDGILMLVNLLKGKGVITAEESEAFQKRYLKPVITIIPEDRGKEYVKQAVDAARGESHSDIAEVRKDIEDVREEMLTRSRIINDSVEELENKVTDELGAKIRKSSWAQRIRWGGDIRLRYQGDFLDEKNALLAKPDEPDELMNTRTDRHRSRIRVRIGMKADLIDDRETNVGKIEAGARVTTGNEEDPVSTNDTLGDYENKDNVVLDRAYLKWAYKPEDTIWGRIPQVSLTGGKMKNPWFCSDLVWDGDVNFEGLTLNFMTDTLTQNLWKGFFTAGAYPLQEVELSAHDKWLYAGQVGIEYNRSMGLSGKLGIAYYDYQNITGEKNDPLRPGEKDYTAPQYQQMGNTLMDIDPSSNIKTALAADYKLLNITGRLDCDIWFPIHIILQGDYVKNIGFDRDEVARRTGNPNVREETEGYQAGLTVGYPLIREFGEWKGFFAYKHLEADATLDAFTDSDFHLGGTNAKGWILGIEYGLFKNVWMRARWLTSDEITGPPLAVDTLQIDVNARF